MAILPASPTVSTFIAASSHGESVRGLRGVTSEAKSNLTAGLLPIIPACAVWQGAKTLGLVQPMASTMCRRGRQAVTGKTRKRRREDGCGRRAAATRTIAERNEGRGATAAPHSAISFCCRRSCGYSTRRHPEWMTPFVDPTFQVSKFKHHHTTLDQLSDSRKRRPHLRLEARRLPRLTATAHGPPSSCPSPEAYKY